MKTIIFAGPSISRDRIRKITDAHVADPVRRGDLLAATDYDTCVILDGEFLQNLSVSPKEILTLLDLGRVVIGASSMGALRAAELKRYGMIGIGWIYNRFVASAVRREDDVALTYSPFDFSPNSIPMVNVEYWMELLFFQGCVTQRERAMALHAARKIFFADRTERRLLTVLGQTLGAERLKTILAATAGTIPDIKAKDAEEAILFAKRLHSDEVVTTTSRKEL